MNITADDKMLIQELRNASGNYPLEVSYFVNNICNLNCAHCYVGYKEKKGGLSIQKMKSVFLDLIELGALTFGNVGKEPTLNWGKSMALLSFLQDQKKHVPKLRYGLVTNAVLLNKLWSNDLLETGIDYLDISVDGDEETHDSIRGKGNYRKTFDNIKIMGNGLKEKVFISFTAMETNKHLIPILIKNFYEIGIKKFLISPYVSTQVGTNTHFKELTFQNQSLVSLVRGIIEGSVIPFPDYHELNIYIKSDFVTSFDLMDEYVKANLIRINELKIDEYGVIFDHYSYGDNKVFLNLLPFDDTFIKTIRLSHDGFIGNCYDMFFTNYPERTIGNVREKLVAEILKDYR